MASLKTSDLIVIGKLGNRRIKDTENRQFYLKIKPDYQHLLPSLTCVFLIFKDHRVRYGKIDISEQCPVNSSSGDVHISIDDEDLLEELLPEREVAVALDTDGLNEIDDQSEYYDPVGMKVIWNDTEVGFIKDFFHNNAHYVYEIEYKPTNVAEMSQSPKTILIPDVDAFVIETNVTENFIRVVDLDQFIDL